ncbi:MAG: hydroxymethylbilane synthase [Ignavibacteriales bacterium]|nr:hydroxymethylbilane synthase [Ignavibacteriales bacterium]
MQSNKIVIGTRGSDLALWQAKWVKLELQQRYSWIEIDTVIIKTTGDKILDSPLSKIGDKGLFTKEIEKALLYNEIDLAVHSLKDVPTQLTPGLILGAISEREDVRDVFIAHPAKKYSSFSDVPKSGKIATGSLRRKCQLLQHRPDLTIIDIRGNLKTRREKLEQSDWDGMLLAKAGVTRLGWAQMITEIFTPTFILPAVGQGALGIEIREDDADLQKLIVPLSHKETEQATTGERALLRHLEGGCQIPIGTFGRIENGKFMLDAMVGSLDGKRIVRGSINGSPEESAVLGISLAEELLSRGAKEILEEIRKNLR